MQINVIVMLQFHFHRFRLNGRRHVSGHCAHVSAVQPRQTVPHSLWCKYVIKQFHIACGTEISSCPHTFI